MRDNIVPNSTGESSWWFLKESCPSKTGPSRVMMASDRKFFFFKVLPPPQKNEMSSRINQVHIANVKFKNKKSQNETHNHTHTPKRPKWESERREKEKDVLSLSLSAVVVVVVLGVYLTQVKVSSRLDWEKKTSWLGMVLGEGFVVFSLSPPLT